MDTEIEKLPRIISKKELRLIVPYTPQYILRLEKIGRFPRRIQIGPRRVGWRLSDVEKWIDERAAEAPASMQPINADERS